ncbi:hypothetical protein NOCARDAX2BIS_520081 [Nocardioides sp. AX2bis]|nr:hypothetical protein NOCARDAX2BIS_520081 [Nocardioides sp. AX2bis]
MKLAQAAVSFALTGTGGSCRVVVAPVVVVVVALMGVFSLVGLSIPRWLKNPVLPSASGLDLPGPPVGVVTRPFG